MNQTFGTAEDMDDIEAILFTSNMRDFTDDYKVCNDLVTDYLAGKKYGAVAVKKHPRDLSLYDYNHINVREYNPMVPGEDIVDKIQKQEVYFMYPSTLLLRFETLGKKKNHIHLFHFRILQRNLVYQNGYERTLQEIGKDGGIEIDIIDI